MKCAAHVQLLPAKRGARGLQRQTHRATAGLVENNIHRQLGRHYRYQLRPNPVLTTTHVTRDSTHIPASLPRVSQPLLQQPLSRISPSTRNSSSKLGQLRHRTKLTSHPLKFYSCKKNNPPSQTPLKNHHLDTNVRTHNTHTHTQSQPSIPCSWLPILQTIVTTQSNRHCSLLTIRIGNCCWLIPTS